MKETHWPISKGYGLTLKIDETSTPAEIEREVEYWMNQLFTYDVPDPDRACILQAIKWMNSL